MTFNENPYYHPEKCGLEIFETIDTGESYEFDMLIVWKKFDNSDHGHDLKLITKETLYGFNEALKNHYRITQEEINNISKKVKDYLNNY